MCRDPQGLKLLLQILLYIYKTSFIDHVPDINILQNVSTNDRCYWSVSGNKNWTEAEIQCVTEGGHLAEIFNGDTQNIAVSLIATEEYYLDELYLIGIGGLPTALSVSMIEVPLN